MSQTPEQRRSNFFKNLPLGSEDASKRKISAPDRTQEDPGIFYTDLQWRQCAEAIGRIRAPQISKRPRLVCWSAVQLPKQPLFPPCFAHPAFPPCVAAAHPFLPHSAATSHGRLARQPSSEMHAPADSALRWKRACVCAQEREREPKRPCCPRLSPQSSLTFRSCCPSSLSP